MLDLDTTVENAGIVNIPFIVRQADASAMRAVFFIHELNETDDDGDPKLMLQ